MYTERAKKKTLKIWNWFNLVQNGTGLIGAENNCPLTYYTYLAQKI
jgi:hypothetical protein